MLPNFLIIGAAKAGTTSLYHQLKSHPDIFMPADPKNKEPTFFSENGMGQWKRGLSWYESLFSDWNGQRAVGEASTGYSKSPAYGDAPEKIRALIPDARLIYLVRDPIKQIVSHYRHIVYWQGLTESLDQSLLHHNFLIDVASYARQIKTYLRFFGRDQILVVLFEDYVKDPAGIGGKICDFLGVDKRGLPSLDRPKNSARGRRIKRWGWVRPGQIDRLPWPIDKGVRRLLTKPLPVPRMSEEAYSHVMRTLGGEIEELRGFMGRDLGEWRLRP